MAAKYSKHTKVADAVEDVVAKPFLTALKNHITNPAFAIPASLLAVGAGAHAMGSALDRMRDARDKAKAYKSMLEMHPHLKTRNPTEVSRIYNSVHLANPHLAKDPMVAGAMVDNVIESSAVHQGNTSQALLLAVKELAGIRSHMSTSLRNEGPGTGAALQEGTRQLSDIAVRSWDQVDRAHGEANRWQAGAKAEKERADKLRVDLEVLKHERHVDRQQAASVRAQEAMRRGVQAGGMTPEQYERLRREMLYDIDPSQFHP